MKTSLLIISDHMDNIQSTASKELMRCALEVEKLTPISIHTVLMGKNLDEPTEYFSQQGSDVTCIDVSTVHKEPKASHLDIAWKSIEHAIYKVSPEIIITSHNTFGMSFLPQLAIHMNATCITGVKKITQNHGKLFYTRYIWNGKFEAQVFSEKKITAISILPGYFVSQQKSETKHGIKHHSKVSSRIKTPIVLKTISRPPVTDARFDNADVIVAAGQGIGKAENIENIKMFSKIFQQSTIAGSRPLIDMGWLPYKYQVGITGQTVAPNLYIACGISGSSQHIAGMRNSKFIVGINSDPNAAIFNVSDLCIVDDCLEFIDKVLDISTSHII